MPKFQKLVKARGGKGYYMRGTFTHHNTDFTNDLFHMADDLGFTELSMEPVVAPADSPEALTEADLPVLYDQYELLAEDMLRREKRAGPSPSTTISSTWRTAPASTSGSRAAVPAPSTWP